MKDVFKRWKQLTSLFFIGFLLAYIRLSARYDMSFFIGIILFTAYYLVTIAFLFRLEYLLMIERLADKLNFTKDLHLIRASKIFGDYSKRRFKIEFWYKTTGKSSSIVRTYFKLYMKNNVNYEEKRLAEYCRPIDGCEIIAIHFNKVKNYLIMKVKKDITSLESATKLMDHLLTVEKEAASHRNK